jgi:hypothetical protein
MLLQQCKMHSVNFFAKFSTLFNDFFAASIRETTATTTVLTEPNEFVVLTTLAALSTEPKIFSSDPPETNSKVTPPLETFPTSSSAESETKTLTTSSTTHYVSTTTSTSTTTKPKVKYQILSFSES